MHHVPIEDTIDLHTFQPREVAIVVEEYLYQAVQRGFVEIRIIHGRGIGVQREIVHSILRKHPAVVAFSDAPDRGATRVTLRTREAAQK
jgi:DNA-nicking Smr family endonuclease